MKNQLKRIFSVLMVVFLLFGIIPMMKTADWLAFSAEAMDYSGTCGTNVSWSLNTSTGELSIIGTGAMSFSDYLVQSDPFTAYPQWESYKGYIKSVVIGNGVTSIGTNAFAGCKHLTSVTIPDSVKGIGWEAFYYCTNLKSITIPASVESFGWRAFWGCTGLTSVTIPNSISNIQSDTFYGVCNIVYNGTASGAPWGARSMNGYVDGYMVYESAQKKELRVCSTAIQGTVTIPNSVTKIATGTFTGAFNECTGLSGVTIGSGVTSIGEGVFRNCTSLTHVIIPDSVTSIGESAFSGCTGLTSVTIPNSVSTIADNAFYLVCNIVYGGSASGSPWGARCRNGFVDGEFVYDSAEKTILRACSATIQGNVIIPNSVTRIADNTFYQCTGLTSVTIGEGVTSIGELAFSNCTRLTSVTIPVSVTRIEDYAFSGCTCLTNVTIPNNTSVYTGAFENVCNVNGKDVAGARSVNGYVEGYFVYESEQKKELRACSSAIEGNVAIPSSVKKIRKNAFCWCNDVTSVFVPASVQEIGDNAFYGINMVYTPYSSYTKEYCDSNRIKWHHYMVLKFNAMGGSGLTDTISKKGLTVYADKPFYPKLPIVDKESVTFLGWFLSEYGAEKAVVGQTFYEDQMLYARWATDFSISSTPRKLSYYVGDTLDTTGLALRAVCDNGETLEISNDFTCTPQVFTEAGSQTVTVSYGDASASFTVNVVEPQPDGLSVRTLPTKTNYFVGDTLDLTGLELLVHQNNDTEFVITDAYTCTTSALLQTPGQQSVTLRYKDLYTSFNISVEEVAATGLTIASPASKTEYYTGDLLSTEGLALRISYNNGTTDVVTSGFVCTPKTLNRAGKQTITVTYEGLNVTYKVTVTQKQLASLSIKQMPKQLVYYAGDTLNTKELQLLCRYNNNDTKTIADFGVVAFTYDFSTAGQKTVVVSYTENGKTEQTSFQVTVLENPEIYGENISAAAGEEFAVPVYIRGNNGIAGFKISLQYDASALTPLRVEAGSILGMDVEGSTNTFSDNAAGNTCGTVDVMWASANNMTDNGVLFTVYFTTDSSIGGNYPIAVSYSERDTFNESFNPVRMICTDATVTLDNSAYTSAPRIRADSITVQKGEQVRVPIRLLHSDGINSVMVLNVNFPTERFTYSSLENGTANVLNATATASGVQIILMNAPAATDSVLFTLVLDVSGKAGGNYTITPVDSTNSIQTESGVISVQTLPTRLYAVDQTTRPETTTVSVPVIIENNRGIMGLDARVTFDPACLRLTGITRGEVLTSGSFLTSTTEPGQVVVLYSNSSETTANGTVFTLEFQVLSALTSHTQITLEYDQENTFNESWNDVVLECSGATVYKICPGDADEDSAVTLQDVVVITRWLAGGWNVTINEMNSDVNRDGVVDLKDVVLIRRFLAGGWNVVLR